jgi:response regulator RpfG family c-di-GMP phosphodiesterase
MKILVADDQKITRFYLKSMLNKNGFEVLLAENGAEALAAMHSENDVGMLISDIQMPVMDGFRLCKEVKTDQRLKNIPVIFYSATFSDEKDRELAYRLGATRFIKKPEDRKELLSVVKSFVAPKNAGRHPSKKPSAGDEKKIFSLYSDRMVEKLEKRTKELQEEVDDHKKDKEALYESEKNLQRTLSKLRKSLTGTIKAIASTVETRDPYTAGHQRRVTDIAQSIASEMDLSDQEIDGIRMAGAIHDIGKISVPAEILSKPTLLTEFEFGIIKGHPKIAFDILKEIDFPWPVAEIVYQHHERIDGSGYPLGLMGSNILMESRVIAVADVVEAMASHRPYRPKLGIDQAICEIRHHRGVLYDQQVVDACIVLLTKKGYIVRSNINHGPWH